MGTLKLFDLVKFSLLDPDLIKVRDNFISSFNPAQNSASQGLHIKIAATHSGIITRNNGFYLPDRMKKGAASFTDNYPKPVLLHHDEHKDPIGRIIQASYRDTSGMIIDKFAGLNVKDKRGNLKGVINEALILDFSNGRMPFGMQVDTITSLFQDSLLQDTSYDGLGYIELVANITDKEAITKLLDGRYLTGSVGATTDSAVCSICRQDFTDTGPCEHRPGGIYDGAKCFIIAGTLTYDEYSFVNTPADRHSKVLELNYNGIQDQIQVESQYESRIYEARLGFPEYQENNEESGMKVKDMTESTTQVQVEEKVETKVEDSTVEIPVVDDIKEENFDDLLTLLLSEEGQLADEKEDRLYDMLWQEVQAAVADGEVQLEGNIEDAQLSAAQRKKLPTSAFCGPDRSFPVPDCAHVVAARRLINRYKGPGNKDSILACVSRKAKAMGCDSKQEDAVVQDNMNHIRLMHSILGLLENDLYYSTEPSLTEEELGAMGQVLTRLSSMVLEDTFQKVLGAAGLIKETDKELKEQVVSLGLVAKDLKDRLEATRKEYTDLFQDFEVVQDLLVEEKTAHRKIKESLVSTLRVLNTSKVETVDFVTISDSKLQSDLNDLIQSVDIVKIADKLGDGMSRMPTGEVLNPVESGNDKPKIKDGTVEMKDLVDIHETYMSLRMSKGQKVAEAYIENLKRLGKLPRE